jgi:hypothetical protein
VAPQTRLRPFFDVGRHQKNNACLLMSADVGKMMNRVKLCRSGIAARHRGSADGPGEIFAAVLRCTDG